MLNMGKTLSAAIWSASMVNDFPDSSFAWIQPGGKKDSSGKTVPRTLRHLPYKDSSGKVDLPHIRNALARLSQVKGMPPAVRESVRRKLQNILGRSKSSSAEKIKTDKEVNLQASYISGFESKIVEADGRKKVILTGTLLDDSINQNGWRVPASEHIKIADKFAGIPIKMQHQKSDWEIVGTGIKAEQEGNKIFYEAEISHTDAVQMFVTGTWNNKNMGISPTLRFKHVRCSICNENLEKVYGHNHVMNQNYDGQKCYYDLYVDENRNLVESSLTSTPAYKPSAGTIDTTYLCASLSQALNFNALNMEDKDMGKTDNESFEAIVLEKDTKIETLQASLNEKEDNVKTLQASIKEKEDKMKEFEASNKELQEKLDKYVIATRQTELEKLLQDKELIAEILKKKMTDEEFKAELATIEKIQASKKLEPTKKGTVPSDILSGTDELIERTDKIAKGMFGENYKILLGEKKEDE